MAPEMDPDLEVLGVFLILLRRLQERFTHAFPKVPLTHVLQATLESMQGSLRESEAMVKVLSTERIGG